MTLLLKRILCVGYLNSSDVDKPLSKFRPVWRFCVEGFPCWGKNLILIYFKFQSNIYSCWYHYKAAFSICIWNHMTLSFQYEETAKQLYYFSFHSFWTSNCIFVVIWALLCQYYLDKDRMYVKITCNKFFLIWPFYLRRRRRKQV